MRFKLLLVVAIYGLLISPCLAMEDESGKHQSRSQALVSIREEPNVEKEEWQNFVNSLLVLSTKLADRCEDVADDLWNNKKLSPEQLRNVEIQAYILGEQLQILKHQINITSAYVLSIEEMIKEMEISEKSGREKEVTETLMEVEQTRKN
ncbi:MAG: hypothetical protein BGO67_01185 [Alphaproteobacteria bacterium 41-28]|nr:MAG: hypothetical protein BGO67_01185 [Alphaproteobacteria bacterium 41-28]